MTYVGLLVNVCLGSLGFPLDKKERLLSLMEMVQPSDRLDKKATLNMAGSLLWSAIAVPGAKAWLADFYVASSKPGAPYSH